MTEQSISLERLEDTISVFGSFDENIRLIEAELGVSVVNRDAQLKISGEDPEKVMYAARVIENLMTLASRGESIGEQNVRYVLQLVREGREEQIHHLAADVLCITAKGKPIKAKTLGQKKYIEAIQKNVVTLGIGPAGTGKTYLAVAAAVAAFREKQVNRIILTRPAVAPLDLINENAIEHIKYRLKHSDKSIKEIAEEFDFPNQSFFGKYVKSYLGMSPARYRNTKEE